MKSENTLKMVLIIWILFSLVLLYNGTNSSCGVAFVDYGEYCHPESGFKCRTNLICNDTCECLGYQYFNGTYCVAKKSYKERCTSSIECDDSKYLQCLNNSDLSPAVCDCASAFYWNSSNCVKLKSFGEYCDPESGLKCGTNLICNNTCGCLNTQYFNGTYCVKKSYKESCNSSIECDDKKYLLCLNNLNLSSAVCDCSSSFYWNSSSCVKRKSYGESCTGGIDRECVDNFYCVYSICRCAMNQYLNNDTCASKLLMYFTSKNYTVTKITSFNGSSFKECPDIQAVEYSEYYIYVSEYSFTTNFLIQFSQNGSFIKAMSFEAVNIEPVNGSLYIASNIEYKQLVKIDLTLTNITLPPPYSSIVHVPEYMRFNPANGYLYATDKYSGYVNAFNLSLNQIPSETFKVSYSNYGGTSGIHYYQSAILGYFIIVTTHKNYMLIIQQSNKTVYKEFKSICRTAYAYNLFVDQKSGYILIACTYDNIVKLWHTNGTEFTDTGKTITIDSPMGISFDSYGRLLISSNNGSFSILTPYDYPF